MFKRYQWEAARGGNKITFAFWLIISIILAIIIHWIVFYMIERNFWGFGQKELDWQSPQLRVEQRVAIEETPEMEASQELEEMAPEEASELLQDIDELLPILSEHELDITAETDTAQIAGEQPMAPLEAGEEFGDLLEPIAAPELPEAMGDTKGGQEVFDEIAPGQITIKEGEFETDLSGAEDALEELSAKKGHGGISDEGLPDGYVGLDKLLGMGTGDLERARTALPGDLTFEFDSAELKEGSRLGLMKLGVLIDRNPKMFCILEGHTDLFGGEEFNKELSYKRAANIRNWLIATLGITGERIIIRAYGKSRPKVFEGDIEAQAINRRVDILMRKEIPPDDTRRGPSNVPLRALPVE